MYIFVVANTLKFDSLKLNNLEMFIEIHLFEIEA